ncbi:MAG: type II toxin-antitoxin system RelE/ParE family toxin [Xanthobacteraceae bacterium]
MRVFTTKVFGRFARKEHLDDKRLCKAIARAERGSIDAELGGNLIKQRVARPGGGRSGGYRTVIAYRASQRSVFLYGFAKSERDNIGDRELDDLKKLARYYLGYSDAQIATAIEWTELREVLCDEQDDG